MTAPEKRAEARDATARPAIKGGARGAGSGIGRESGRPLEDGRRALASTSLTHANGLVDAGF
jgi:hypothetical protein